MQVRVAFIVLVSDNSMKGSVEPEMLLHMLRLLDDPAFQVPLFLKPGTGSRSCSSRAAHCCSAPALHTTGQLVC